jgi:LysM repeat protein
LVRAVAPIAFLAAVTIAVLLIRSGLESNDAAAPPTATTAVSRAHPAARHGHKPKRVPKVYYTVRSGDTFGSIAARYVITVAQLEALNPSVSSNALVVGQKIRVK